MDFFNVLLIIHRTITLSKNVKPVYDTQIQKKKNRCYELCIV